MTYQEAKTAHEQAEADLEAVRAQSSEVYQLIGTLQGLMNLVRAKYNGKPVPARTNTRNGTKEEHK